MQAVAQALSNLEQNTQHPLIEKLGRAFDAAGHELALVGGPVRDAILGRIAPDLDFTTSANPDQILKVVKPIATATWDIGREFGTIAAQIDGEQVEITSYRADSYDKTSRKPTVEFGDNLEDDLIRRDFTVNAMALRLRYHDEAIHNHRAPQGENARAVFESLKRVRVEALGGRMMAGVKANLRAALEDRCDASGYIRVNVRDDAPLAEAIGLMVRQKLTGEALPEGGAQIVDLWRDWINDKVDTDLDALSGCLEDQEAYADALTRILIDLELIDEESEATEQQEGEQGENADEQDTEDVEGEGEDTEGVSADMSGSESSEMEEMDAEDEMED